MNRFWRPFTGFPISGSSGSQFYPQLARYASKHNQNSFAVKKKQFHDDLSKFGVDQFPAQLANIPSEQVAKMLNEHAPREWKEAMLKYLVDMRSKGYDVQTISDSDEDAEPAVRFLRVY